MKLSTLQSKIIEAPDNKIVVISAAASGKTALLTEKIRQILKSGANPKEIAVITFTNMAAEEMRHRLGDDYKDGLYLGTIHGLANYMLLSKGIDTKTYLEKEDFDKLFELIEENPQCIRHMSWVILDEAQDSDEQQFRFLFEMINPDNFFVVGDNRQCIYQFKMSNPQLMLDLANEPGVKTFSMNENYRNGSTILNFAKRLISPLGLSDDSIPMREISGSVTEVPFSTDTIIKTLQGQPRLGEWAILTRTNREIEQIGFILKQNNIPFVTFKQSELNKSQLTKKLESNTVKLLTIHSAKGLAFNNVIVVGTRFYPAEERNVAYVAATRARNKLIWMGNMGQPKRKKPAAATTKMVSW